MAPVRTIIAATSCALLLGLAQHALAQDTQTPATTPATTPAGQQTEEAASAPATTAVPATGQGEQTATGQQEQAATTGQQQQTANTGQQQAPAAQAAPSQAPAQPASTQAAPAQATPGQTVPSQTQTVPGQTVPGQTVPGQTTPGQTVPGQTIPGQTAPGQTIPGQTAPGQTVPGQPVPGQPTAAGMVDPSTYVPRTEHDNTPWRFNMTQGGKNMTAEEFDQWLKQRGVRVATGKPTKPLIQNCPTPEGDKGDSDGDGIINCLDQCPASEAGQTIGPDGCPVPVSIDLQGVTFAYDKAILDKEATTVLDETIKILKEHEALKVEVAGHTDSRGDPAYNQKLSERRAKAVYDYLVKSGIDKARLIGPVGYGESKPLVPNQNPDGSDNPANRAKNRRTELNIQN